MKKPALLFSALLVIIVSACLPLSASRWQKGSTVEVAMTDGRFISGELLAVKGNELIIHDKSIDRGFTVDINQVSEIRIKKKSRVFTGLAIGLIAGLGIGAGIATTAGVDRGDDVGIAMMSFSAPFLAATIGGIIGANQSRPKKISVKEQPPIQVEWSLRYLAEHARWRNRWKNIYLKNK